MHPPTCFLDVSEAVRAYFWRWLSEQVWDAPEFAELSPEQKARLSVLLKAEAGPHGAIDDAR